MNFTLIRLNMENKKFFLLIKSIINFSKAWILKNKAANYFYNNKFYSRRIKLIEINCFIIF
jgi:hypothetical protein